MLMYLLIPKIRIKLKRQANKKREMVFDVKKMFDPEIRKVFKIQLIRGFQE